MSLKILTPQDCEFPSPELALDYPKGLLAVGGDLSIERLQSAYRQGIFPWYNRHEPILWWSPNPRAVLFPDQLIINRSLRQALKKQNFEITVNQAFIEVIHACSQPRPTQSETWLHPQMIEAYINLHKAGFARSIEVWRDKQLIGGLYGVDLGHVFCGESMFNRQADAAKIALVYLAQQTTEDIKMIDCQLLNPFLASMGAKNIPRHIFLQFLLKKN